MTRPGAIHLTTEQIEEARRLADYGVSRRIGARETHQRRYKPDKRISKTGRENATSIDVKADAAARLAEVPKDTRSLTGFLAGDPLPGRSALDKRQHS